jgi:hypothetical protein
MGALVPSRREVEQRLAAQAAVTDCGKGVGMKTQSIRVKLHDGSMQP